MTQFGKKYQNLLIANIKISIGQLAPENFHTAKQTVAIGIRLLANFDVLEY